MIVLNNSDKEISTITKERYLEAMKGFTLAQSYNRHRITDLASFKIAPKTAMIIELK